MHPVCDGVLMIGGKATALSHYLIVPTDCTYLYIPVHYLYTPIHTCIYPIIPFYTLYFIALLQYITMAKCVTLTTNVLHFVPVVLHSNVKCYIVFCIIIDVLH